ncbi:diguanylate cyclase (GGDEF)-like protein/PAS domain S-box-containing protein [Rhizobium aquaticum]|uniref:Diguanylate cyclase (GGDEF)-like protein/PAS domain S-box-containing protein n=1 Tax=Rhizobium aquaticum TaxID=1549636 RepID=A0ABV2IYL6_9HYPH
MGTVTRLPEAARYLEGVIFVLRKEAEDTYALDEAQGALGPLVFDDPAATQTLYQAALAMMTPRRRRLFLDRMRDIFRRRGPVTEFLEVVLGETILNIEIRGEVTETAEGVFLAGYARDCTETERLGAQRKAEAILSATVQLFPDMVWLKDEDGRYVLCNEMFDRFNNVPSAQLVGKTASETDQGKRAPIHDSTDRQALVTNDIVTFEHAVQGPDGETRFFDVRKLALRDDEGKPIAILGTARETTQWRRLVNELGQRENAYRTLADNLPDSLIRVARDGQLLNMNRPMREFFESANLPPLEDALTRDLSGVTNGPATMEMMRSIGSVFETGEACTIELDLTDGTGLVYTHEIRLFPEFGQDSVVESVLAIGRDVTERKEMEKRLAQSEAEMQALAFRDSLTGLHNRRSFQSLLQTVLDDAYMCGSISALLLLDIDRFKYINDTLGHAVGDELIFQFGRLLIGAVGKEGHVCRLGGDEFAVVMPAVAEAADAEKLAQRIHDALQSPIDVGIDRIAITTSIGVAFGVGETFDQYALFRFADMALYAAKAAGRARTTVYDNRMATEAQRRFELENQINDGLRNNEFQAFFQAKVDLRTGAINGAEALCRWIRQDGSFVSPGAFIPISEETGQIIEIGRRVLLDSCRFAVAVNAGRAEPIAVSVNVSARQLLFGGFLGTLGACLEETGCKGQWLELEITESLLLGDDSNISETLHAIVGLDVSLTIDDFGTGYSSLSYLARFPITTLKIDQAFVRDLERNDKNAVLCRAIISMAQGLGLKTVAEGIETEEVAERLKTLGCDTGQGYLWSRPQPADRIIATIRAEMAANALPGLLDLAL